MVRSLVAAEVAALSPLYGDDDGPSLPFLSGLLARSSALAWRAESSGQSLAVIWVSRVVDEAEILDLRVLATHRRQGFGRLLLRHALLTLTASGINALFLEVRRSNVAAITLYEAAGFASIGVRKDYYTTASGREDAVLMRCVLTER